MAKNDIIRYKHEMVDIVVYLIIVVISVIGIYITLNVNGLSEKGQVMIATSILLIALLSTLAYIYISRIVFHKPREKRHLYIRQPYYTVETGITK